MLKLIIALKTAKKLKIINNKKFLRNTIFKKLNSEKNLFFFSKNAGFTIKLCQLYFTKQINVV